MNFIARWVLSIKVFLKEVRGEMKKVSWPNRQTLISSTKAVIISTLLLGIYIGGLDVVFDNLLTWLSTSPMN